MFPRQPTWLTMTLVVILSEVVSYGAVAGVAARIVNALVMATGVVGQTFIHVCGVSFDK